MSSYFRFTLVTDGSSDRALLPIILWALVEAGISDTILPTYADFTYIPLPKRASLAEKIANAIKHFPCELLVVHRDAEAQSPDARSEEVNRAISLARNDIPTPPYVVVIPIRMTEAWLLLDGQAIKDAAGNSRFRHALSLPQIQNVESIADPKALLHDLLRTACGLSGRRLESFDVYRSAIQVVDHMNDFTILRRLNSFRRFEKELGNTISMTNLRQP